MRFFLLSLILAVGFVGGCDFGGGIQDQVRDQLEDARQRWQEQNLQDYQLVYAQQRGETIVDTARVFVRSGAVDSISTSPDDIPDDELLVGTVESFFALIESRIGEEESQLGANFDTDQGFPTSYDATFEDERRDQDIITITLLESDENNQQ